MLERLVRQGGAYALAGALLKGAGLLLAPLLLNATYLSVPDYGSYALLMITAQLVIYVAGLGLATALIRFMTGDARGTDRDRLPVTALILAMGSAVVAAALLVLAARPLAVALTDSPEGAALMIPLAAYVAAKCASSIPLAVLRVRERAGLYTLAVVVEMVALVGLAWWQLAGLQSGLPGLLLAYAISAAVGLVVMLLLTAPGTNWRVSTAAMRPLLAFGTPLILASLSIWFLNAGDRYLLKWLADREAVAAYEWSARLAGLINMLLVQSFQLAFTVLGLKALQAGAEAFYRRTMRHFSIWTGAAVLMLVVWTPDGMRVLQALFSVDDTYLQASVLVFPLALGFAAYGVYVIVNNTLLAAGRTGVIGANVLIAALVNIALNVALIPQFGAMGAAVATTFSYALLAALAAFAARRDLKVRYPWRIPAVVVTLLVVLGAASLAMDGIQPALRIPGRMLLIGAYVAAVPALGLYTPHDLAAGWAKIRAITGQPPGHSEKQGSDPAH